MTIGLSIEFASCYTLDRSNDRLTTNISLSIKSTVDARQRSILSVNRIIFSNAVRELLTHHRFRQVFTPDTAETGVF